MPWSRPWMCLWPRRRSRWQMQSWLWSWRTPRLERSQRRGLRRCGRGRMPWLERGQRPTHLGLTKGRNQTRGSGRHVAVQSCGGSLGRLRGPASRGYHRPPAPAAHPPISDRCVGCILAVLFRSRAHATAQFAAEADVEVVADAVGDQRSWSWSWSLPRTRLLTRPRPSSWPAPVAMPVVAVMVPTEVAGTVAGGVVAKTVAMFTSDARGRCRGHGGRGQGHGQCRGPDVAVFVATVEIAK